MLCLYPISWLQLHELNKNNCKYTKTNSVVILLCACSHVCMWKHPGSINFVNYYFLIWSANTAQTHVEWWGTQQHSVSPVAGKSHFFMTSVFLCRTPQIQAWIIIFLLLGCLDNCLDNWQQTCWRSDRFVNHALQSLPSLCQSYAVGYRVPTIR